LNFKLLSYNIRFGGRKRQSLIADVVRTVSPDIVVFQEATDPGVIAYIALEAGFQYTESQPGRSLAYISRIPVANHEWIYPPGARHPVIEIVLSDNGFRIYGLHLKARFSKWSEARRTREIKALLSGIEDNQGPHVIVGDFNTLAPGELLEVQRMPRWIRTLVWLSGRDIQRETIGTMLSNGYLDVFRTLYPDRPGFTFPIWDPHLRLDYAFVNPAARPMVKACEVIDNLDAAKKASDHFPLLTEFEVA
jgi:endonuclease/exonuclease/phosphatase family metal-dependent hydrolase